MLCPPYTLVTGIGLVVLFDFILKWLKARLVNEAGDQVDAELQTQLFKKVLSWDLESRPKQQVRLQVFPEI